MMNSGVSASNASASWTSEALPDGVVPPDVAAFGHRDVGQLVRGGGAVDHQDVLDRVVPGDGGVGVVLDRHGHAAAELAVGGDQELGAGVLHPELQRLGGEAAEHQGMDGADAGHGEGDDDGFGDDREVDDHAVALGDAQVQEGVGGLGHLALQFGVGDGAAVAGLALEVEGHLVAAAGRDMAVHAVVGDVELAALEPGDVRAGAGLDVGRDAPVRGVPGLAAVGAGALRRVPPSRGGGPVLPRRQPCRLDSGVVWAAGEGGAAVTRRPVSGDAVHCAVRGLGQGPSRRAARGAGRVTQPCFVRRRVRSGLWGSAAVLGAESGQWWAGQKNSLGSLQHSIGPGSSTLSFLRQEKEQFRGNGRLTSPGVAAASSIQVSRPLGMVTIY